MSALRAERGIVRLDARAAVTGALRGGIVALGNFDGFHLGHQAVARHAIDWARREGRPAIIATFDPHPARHFAPDAPPFRLTTLDQRQALFAQAGADAMLVFGFDATLADTSAAAFVRDLLAERIGASAVVSGEDFVFGKGRAGDIALLQEIGGECGLRADAVGPVLDGGAPVSSSRIRTALREGRPEEAARLLTRPFAIRGVVEHGDRVGRTLGFPTANLSLGSYLRPRYGIYAVTGNLGDGRVVKGAANLGIRPQFDPPKELLEPHFFDFDDDLYGREIEVSLHHWLRGEERYDSLDALTEAIAKDCAAARALLG